ncbi:hypothetical protein AAC387_Pa02g4829 [Persea americana]
MADSIEGSKNLIRLEVESEGNSIGTRDFIFRKISLSSHPIPASTSKLLLRTFPSGSASYFSRIPKGFNLAKTKDVIELAKKI